MTKNDFFWLAVLGNLCGAILKFHADAIFLKSMSNSWPHCMSLRDRVINIPDFKSKFGGGSKINIGKLS